MHATAYQRRVFGTLLEARSRIIDALTLHISPIQTESTDTRAFEFRTAAKLSACCREAQVVTTDDPTVGIAERRCKSRLCPRCSKLRAQALTARLIEAVKRMDSPRLLTLTMKSSHEPLREQMLRLTESFKKLRRRADWKHHIAGGCYTLEVTYNHATEQWHPHLHAIIDGTYWRQGDIADAWEQVTGDSRIVDIRIVHSARDAARYVSSYVAKSSDINQMPDDRIPEWAAQVHGLRLIQTFGSLHGTQLTADDDDDTGDLHHAAWADDLATAARDGDAAAESILSEIISPSTNLPRRIDGRQSENDAARVSSLARRVRDWQAQHRKETHRATPQPRPDPPRNDRPDYRPLWDREDLDHPVPCRAVRPTTIH